MELFPQSKLCNNIEEDEHSECYAMDNRYGRRNFQQKPRPSDEIIAIQAQLKSHREEISDLKKNQAELKENQDKLVNELKKNSDDQKAGFQQVMDALAKQPKSQPPKHNGHYKPPHLRFNNNRYNNQNNNGGNRNNYNPRNEFPNYPCKTCVEKGVGAYDALHFSSNCPNKSQ